jgi:hypothetical protein
MIGTDATAQKPGFYRAYIDRRFAFQLRAPFGKAAGEARASEGREPEKNSPSGVYPDGEFGRLHQTSEMKARIHTTARACEPQMSE